MELKLYHMGSIAELNEEQRAMAEAFINEQVYGVVATNHLQTGARLSCLNNMPEFRQRVDLLYFATDAATEKVANLKADPRFEILYTDGNSQLVLRGQIRVNDDPSVRRAMWHDRMYAYFTGGPDSEQYCLLEFQPEEARIMLADGCSATFLPATLEPVHIVGIAVRTSNAAQQSTNDIGNLWARFWSDEILPKIPNRVSDDLYAVYTEYEGDAMQPYTLVIGCPVKSLDQVPEGMKGVTIEGGNYLKTSVSGKISEGVVQQGWMSVWQADIHRKYQADFEYYKCDGFDPDHAEVDIFVGIK